jgi:signal transduction histidine kinase
MILKLFNKSLEELNRHGEEYGFPYILFACFLIFNYIYDIPWAIWSLEHEHDPFLEMHVFSLILAIVLLFKKFLPPTLAKYYSLYWYLTIIWCLPFSTTFILFHHPEHTNTLLTNAMLAIFTIILIVDWLSFLVIIITGILLGWLAQYLFYGPSHLDISDIKGAISVFIWTLLVGILFSRNAARYHLNLQLQKQLTAVRTVCASIAHELRTPLLSIKGGANGIKLFIPRLLAGYKAAAEAKLDIPRIFPSQIKQIERVIDNIESEVNFSNTVIDTLLLNATQIAVNPQVYTPNSMAQCIKAALLRYPFNPSEQLEIVHFNDTHNFTYHGDELLMTHVIFNLLKNALYAIAETQKGEIFIWLTNGSKYNYMHFKDTAKGITKEEQEKLFEPFNSNTPVGTGIGLSFCRMVMQNLGGDIELHTKAGDYAEFILKFPKIDWSVKEMIRKPQ